MDNEVEIYNTEQKWMWTYCTLNQFTLASDSFAVFKRVGMLIGKLKFRSEFHPTKVVVSIKLNVEEEGTFVGFEAISKNSFNNLNSNNWSSET